MIRRQQLTLWLWGASVLFGCEGGEVSSSRDAGNTAPNVEIGSSAGTQTPPVVGTSTPAPASTGVAGVPGLPGNTATAASIQSTGAMTEATSGTPDRPGVATASGESSESAATSAPADAGAGGDAAPGFDAGLGGGLGAGGAAESGGEGSAACNEEANLTLVTFNIRYDSGGGGGADAWNAASNPRRERVVTTINALSPDVLGVQEALSNQVNDLTAILSDYEFFGVGRDDGMTQGEYAGIFYRSTRFERVEGGHFWLSETPELPGTVFEGSGSIRMATWVVLRDSIAARDIFVLNTHLDNISQSSREASAALIRDRTQSLSDGLPQVVMGDLNQAEDNLAVQTLLVGPPAGAGLLDAYRIVHPMRESNEATFHEFTGNPMGQRIDFVLHDDNLAAHSASIDRTEFSERYASDHFPVAVDLGWTRDDAGEPCR